MRTAHRATRSQRLEFMPVCRQAHTQDCRQSDGARHQGALRPVKADHGVALDDDQLLKLVRGFEGSGLFPIVSVAAFTGARQREILALRWSDLDAANARRCGSSGRLRRPRSTRLAHQGSEEGAPQAHHNRSMTTCWRLLLSQNAKSI